MNREDWFTLCLSLALLFTGILQASGDPTGALISFVIAAALGIILVTRNWGVWRDKP